MPQFTNKIADDVRNHLTLPPPPMYDIRTGVLVPVDAGDRYNDVAVVKASNIVYVDEELDVWAYPGSCNHYRMMIRRMPWKADLMLILEAARHMQLVDRYELNYEHREGLLPEMESGFWDVAYTIPKEQVKVDADTLVWKDIVISYSLRKCIWIELFSAMGHKVKWGGSVLNVRKRKP